MKVILRTTVDNLGRAGDVKEVKPGYGRNFLLPRKLAEPATEAALKYWEKGKEKRKAVEVIVEQRAEERDPETADDRVP